MKGMLDPAIAIDRAGHDAAEGGGGDDGGCDPEVLWFLDPRNVATRGVPSIVVGEGDVTGFCLCLLDRRGKLLQEKEEGFSTSMIDGALVGSQCLW